MKAHPCVREEQATRGQCTKKQDDSFPRARGTGLFAPSYLMLRLVGSAHSPVDIWQEKEL